MSHSIAARRAEALSKQDSQREARRQEKRRAKAERRKAHRAEQATTVDSGGTAVGVVAEHAEPVAVARYGLMELDDMKVVDLKKIAKDLGLKGYTSFPKIKLVEFIYRSPENLR